jgi:murein DD-endopeptidase MepM/ murein hydrolase activator NlpD
MSSKGNAVVRFMQLPLRNCVLRCDPYLRLVIGGTYGYTRGAGKRFHGGVDLYAKENTECFAIYNGCVEWVEDFGKKGWGLTILTRVTFPEWTCWALYAHLTDTYVKKGSRLEPGTLIGRTGVSGNGDSDYPHLHFEIWSSTKAGLKGTREKYRLNPLYVLGPLPFQPFALDVIERNQHINRTA